ncbi:MAG: serine/threonine-protein kinase [Planctomycetota bacterium]
MVDGQGATETDLSNRSIGEFRLLRRLGSGGMADVYLAEQASLGRHVAVKILRAEALRSNGEVLLRRFDQEARAAGGLSHPNVVQVLTTGREGDLAWIVQEYVPGLNLSQWIRRHGPPDYATGLRWLQQITAALRAAADAGIVHRDVKPENILLTRDGTAKVTDFGLAQLSQPHQPRMNLTQAGTTMGTPWYMSPEQIEGRPLDHRSDQYSLGITAWHMFAGRPPFPGKNPMTVAVQHLQETPASLARFRADLPSALCKTIDRMLLKKPDDRYPNMAILEQAFLDLNQVPVNDALPSGNGWKGFLLRSRGLITAGGGTAAVCFLAGHLMARTANPPIRLPALNPSAEVASESTAERQFARAMLQPDRLDLWRAVITRFPETLEADIASMQLGIALMSSPVPDPNQARQAFRAVRERGELALEKRHLQLLGMIGEAWVLKDRERTAELDLLLSEIYSRLDEYESEDVLQLDIDQAPEELQQFFTRILQTRRQQENTAEMR